MAVDCGQRRSAADVHRLIRKRDRRPNGVPERTAPARLAGRGVESADGLIVAAEKDDAVSRRR